MKGLSVMYDYGEIELSFIYDFERKYDIKFPESYVSFIREYNGVQFNENTFNYLDKDGSLGESSIGFCAFGNVRSTSIDDLQDYDVYGDDKIITFGLNGGGDYIAFDYRKNPESDNPPVIIMYHDDYVKDENGNTKTRIIKVADNFEDFLNLLHE